MGGGNRGGLNGEKRYVIGEFNSNCSISSGSNSGRKTTFILTLYQFYDFINLFF